MARITDLAEELTAQIVEGLFEDGTSLRKPFLARGISKTFARIIDHRLLTSTPLKTYLHQSNDQRGAMRFLKANLASHLYEHTWKPKGANTELPKYIALVVGKLMKFAPADAETADIRDAYIMELANAAVAAEPATAVALLTNPKLTTIGEHRAYNEENSRRWRYVEGLRIEGLDLAAAAAAVGNTEALWHYLAYDTVRLYDASLVFGSAIATAASTGRAEVLEVLLERLHEELGKGCPNTLLDILLEATNVAIRSRCPNSTIILVHQVLKHFAVLHQGETFTYGLRESWCLAATETGNVDLVLALLGQLDRYNNNDDPMLLKDLVYHHACERGHIRIVKRLLDWRIVGTGATLSSPRTPIISALQHNSQGVIKLLLQCRARYNTPDLWHKAVTCEICFATSHHSVSYRRWISCHYGCGASHHQPDVRV